MINVFIPHRWNNDDYEAITVLLDRTKYNVRDYSVPSSAPFDSIDRRYNVDPKIQRQILDNASKYLKINGEIVYSTCTIEKEENEAVTDSFTADNENFEKVFEKTFYPHIDNTDGFYICRMKRIK